MNKSVIKKIIVNNLIFLLIELAILGLVFLGIFDFLFVSNDPSPFVTNLGSLIFLILVVLLVSTIVAYKRYNQTPISIFELSKYYVFSFFIFIISIAFLFSLFPAFSTFTSIILTILFFIVFSWCISFFTIHFKNVKK